MAKGTERYPIAIFFASIHFAPLLKALEKQFHRNVYFSNAVIKKSFFLEIICDIQMHLPIIARKTIGHDILESNADTPFGKIVIYL